MADSEEAKTHPPDDQAPRITHVRPPNLPNVYINSANVALGGLEMRLYLAETTPTEDGEGLIVTDRVCVVMTPEFAKFMSASLLESMNKFEARFGPLRNVLDADNVRHTLAPTAATETAASESKGHVARKRGKTGKNLRSGL
ncbi:MAG TPA: DUF3467 domain-containing protein [Terriglobia bacterium]|jgi:hypothetical protein|nr:DUF3467 domain-containing protein [Terriglobia bacterium]